MSEETATPTVSSPPPPKKWTFSDVNANVPHDWMGAEICVCSNSSFRIHRVKRIALVRNRNGKKVVVLYSTDLQPTEEE